MVPPHVQLLDSLLENPPAPLVAIQSRLAALYPEYEIAHMPADQLGDSGNGVDEPQPLSSFVGNAVMRGDPCQYHVDADPSDLPACSPWVHNHGFYHNRCRSGLGRRASPATGLSPHCGCL